MKKPEKKKLKSSQMVKKGFGCRVEREDWVIRISKHQPTRHLNTRNRVFQVWRDGKYLS
jgi:hypothetical protein